MASHSGAFFYKIKIYNVGRGGYNLISLLEHLTQRKHQTNLKRASEQNFQR